MNVSSSTIPNTELASNRAWWLAMPQRLAARRPKRWRDYSYDEQRALLGLPVIT